MARGVPAFWGGLGTTLFGVLGWVVSQSGLPASGLITACFVGFGVLVGVLGVYVQARAAPSDPSLRDGETMETTRNPTQRVASTKVLGAIPVLGLTVYWLTQTQLPYVYPTITLLAGLWLFTTGLKRYWINSLTTYYLTDQRIISEYRFISLQRNRIPLEQVRGVSEERSLLESLAGLGNVRVSSGDSGALTVFCRHITNPGQFADRLQATLS